MSKEDGRDCAKLLRCVLRVPCQGCDSYEPCDNVVVTPPTIKEAVDEMREKIEEHKAGKPGGSCPSQYAIPENSSDLQDLIEYRGMNFALGNIFKACYRRGTCSHSDDLRDVRKIIWFANRELVRLSLTDPS